jgi:Na+-translocating ferredoxin:NAD+ oxidoreductase subunit E
MASRDDRPALPEVMKGLWRENPVLIALLGLCPAMAVTNTLMNALVMGAASTFVLVGSSVLVSLLRHAIPKAVRISTFIIIIATFVTIVDFTLAALMPAAHKQLGAFIPLIVCNCLILGRQEAFASRNGVRLAIADAVGMSAGFTLALVMIGAVREILGFGTLLGVSLLGPNFEPWAIMILPPGGFLSLGALLMLFSWMTEKRRQREATAGARAEDEPVPERKAA